MAFKRIFEFHSGVGLRQKKVTPTEARGEDLLLNAALISNWELAVLYAIFALGHASSSEIASLVSMDRPTVARCLRSLIRLHAIETDPVGSTHDVSVSLSEAGETVLRKGMRLWTCTKQGPNSDGTEPSCLMESQR